MNRKHRKLLTCCTPRVLLVGLSIAIFGMLVLSGQGLAATLFFCIAAVGSLNRSFSMNGHAFSLSPTYANQEFGVAIAIEMDLPAGKVVTSWVKGAGAGDATANLPAGHGYANGNFDVFWVVAGVLNVRYGVPGTIVTNALTLAGGAGDTFPASATAGIVVTRQVTRADISIDGDNVEIIGLHFRSTDTTAFGSADLLDAGNASIEQFDLTEVDNSVTGLAHGYVGAAAVALLTGNIITQIRASNGSSTASAKLWVDVGVT